MSIFADNEIEHRLAQSRASRKQETDAALLKHLQAALGYVANGTSQSVTIFQDDATREWVLMAGKKMFSDSSLTGVIAQAGEYFKDD